MKSFIYVLMLSLVGNVAYAQNDQKAKLFINEIIIESNVSYLDSVDINARNFMDNALKQRRKLIRFHKDSVDYVDHGVKKRMLRNEATRLLLSHTPDLTGYQILEIVADSLVLTDAEITYAHSEIKRMRTHVWQTGLLLNAKLLNSDSLTVMQKRWSDYRDQLVKSKDFIDHLINSKGFTDLKLKDEGLTSYLLSRPIFLRNDSYCLFYYSVDYSSKLSPTSTGSGKFAVYKKENGKWVTWGSISSWTT